jgi:Ca2+-transporting ATPase
VFSIGLLSNRFLLVGIAFEVALLVALVTVPPFQDVFHMQALDPLAWPFLLIWPVFVFAGEELRKAIFRRYVWGR